MFEALLPLVHRFSMNAYDYQTPGPNAPFPWLRTTLNALTDAEKEKILLGLPFYGYDNSGRVEMTVLELLSLTNGGQPYLCCQFRRRDGAIVRQYAQRGRRQEDPLGRERTCTSVSMQ